MVIDFPHGQKNREILQSVILDITMLFLGNQAILSVEQKSKVSGDKHSQVKRPEYCENPIEDLSKIDVQSGYWRKPTGKFRIIVADNTQMLVTPINTAGLKLARVVEHAVGRMLQSTPFFITHRIKQVLFCMRFYLASDFIHIS